MPQTDWAARLRAAVEAYNRGDYEAVLAHAGDEVELRRPDNSPDSGEVLRGRAAVVGFFRPDVFADQRLELLGFAVAPEVLLAHMRFSARGAGSGLPAEIESWILFWIEDELIERIEIHADEATARASAGLD